MPDLVPASFQSHAIRDVVVNISERLGPRSPAEIKNFVPYRPIGIESWINQQYSRRRRFTFKMNITTHANRKHLPPSLSRIANSVKKICKQGRIKPMSFRMILHAEYERMRLQSCLLDDSVTRGPGLYFDSNTQVFERLVMGAVHRRESMNSLRAVSQRLN